MSAVEFARYIGNLVLRNGGIFPVNMEKLYEDWKDGKVKKFNPNPMKKEEIVKKDTSVGECKYIHQRKAVRGTVCGVITKNGNEYCPKHLAYVKLKERKANGG